MGLNKQKGNMYPWVTHTWNPIKGRCPHDCSYCYMKRFPQPELHFDRKELKTNLGSDNTIFVGSSCDMWAEEIPGEWIQEIIEYIFDEYWDNAYLFQSKNPKRFFDFIDSFHDETTIGTTLETNRDTSNISKAPKPQARVPWMWELTDRKYQEFERMVSIEPIMDFDLVEFSMMIRNIHPDFVSIGADSKGHNLPEPSKENTLKLIDELKQFTEVKIKNNLGRIINQKEK